MDKKSKIINLYFDKKYKPIQIAKELDISNSYVTKIIKQDERYETETINRKYENKIKNLINTKNYIKQKRTINRELDAYVKQQHIQASLELSGRNHISNRSFRRWNSSAYTYNYQKECFEFDKKLGRSYAIPKYVKQ